MAIYVNKDIQVKVNTVDLTAYVTNVEVVRSTLLTSLPMSQTWKL
jgi:hypothetical protein